jgi:hypothetical protein
MSIKIFIFYLISARGRTSIQKILRRLFGLKKLEVRGKWRKLYNA